jgi:hypothetical protein
MIRTGLISSVILSIAVTAAAQDRSADEQALLDIVAACNDGWSASVEHNDHALFASACPFEPDGIYWYTAGGPDPVTYTAADGFWSRSAGNNRRVLWRDLEPVAVRIYGDLALVYFTVTWIVEPYDGETTENPSRRVAAFRRDDAGWIMVGGSIAPVPASQ